MMGTERAGASSSTGPKRVDLGDVAPPPREVVPSGDELLDVALNGGWTKGRLYLVAGVPACGKTTRLLRSCAAVVRARGRAVLVAGEMPPAHLREVCTEARINPKGIVVVEADSLADVVLDRRTDLVVIDSITVMAEGAEKALKRARRFAARGAAVVAIAQSTKEGGYRGTQALEHDVDAALWLELAEVLVRKARAGTGRMGTFPVTPRPAPVTPRPANDN
jgi:predicted ATP-dependent serine protease